MRRFLTLLLGVLAFIGQAHAYRPFDGTNAGVADVGELELELQPAGLLHEPPQTFLVAPSSVVSLGVAEGWEVNAQSQLETPVGHGASFLAGTGVFAKHVLRDGFMQEKEGPSIATEFGVIVPEFHGASNVGTSADLILSLGGSWGAVHFNLQPEITARQHADLFLDAIIEGPGAWKVRPVAELFVNRDFAGPLERSALIGAIWQVKDQLSVDVALRGARLDAHDSAEIRAGFTYAFTLW
ncbi:MAG TPA: hypothetical protein VKT70_07830 [Stellaceae bacterium]|nr:hypothetical protein [Stellaceae bacterium]